MNSIFGRNKEQQDEVEKKLLQLPEPPTVDQIVDDLEDASPSDVVFNTDIAALLSETTDVGTTELPKRFQNIDASSPDSHLYEKVIQHNQNVERIAALKQQLPEVQSSLSQLKEDLTDDITRVSVDFKKAAELHQEVNSNSSN